MTGVDMAMLRGCEEIVLAYDMVDDVLHAQMSGEAFEAGGSFDEFRLVCGLETPLGVRAGGNTDLLVLVDTYGVTDEGQPTRNLVTPTRTLGTWLVDFAEITGAERPSVEEVEEVAGLMSERFLAVSVLGETIIPDNPEDYSGYLCGVDTDSRFEELLAGSSFGANGMREKIPLNDYINRWLDVNGFSGEDRRLRVSVIKMHIKDLLLEQRFDGLYGLTAEEQRELLQIQRDLAEVAA